MEGFLVLGKVFFFLEFLLLLSFALRGGAFTCKQESSGVLKATLSLERVFQAAADAWVAVPCDSPAEETTRNLSCCPFDYWEDHDTLQILDFGAALPSFLPAKTPVSASMLLLKEEENL